VDKLELLYAQQVGMLAAVCTGRHVAAWRWWTKTYATLDNNVMTSWLQHCSTRADCIYKPLRPRQPLRGWSITATVWWWATRGTKRVVCWGRHSRAHQAALWLEHSTLARPSSAEHTW